MAKTVPLNWTVKWLHSPSRVPGCRQACDSEIPVARSPWDWCRCGVPGRQVLEQDQHQHDGEAGHRGERQEGRGPPGGVQDHGERHHAEELAELAGHAGQLRQQRDAGRGEPERDQPDHGDKRHGVTGAHQHASQDSAGNVVGKRQLKLAESHQDTAAGQHGAGAEAVHEHAYRNLQRRVDQQLQHGEEGDLRGAGVEAFRCLQADHAEGGALADRHEIGEDPDDPDQPGAGRGHSPIMPGSVIK